MVVRCGKCSEFRPTADFRKSAKSHSPHGVLSSVGCAQCRKHGRPRKQREIYPCDAVIVERLRAVYESEGLDGMVASSMQHKYGGLFAAIKQRYKKREIDPHKKWSVARYAQCVFDATGLNYENDVRKRKLGGAFNGWSEAEIVGVVRCEIDAGRGMSFRDVQKRFPSLYGALSAYGRTQPDCQAVGEYGAGLTAVMRKHIDPTYSYEDTLEEGFTAGMERMSERAAAGFRFEDIFHDVLNALDIDHTRGGRSNGVDFRLSETHIIDTKLSRGTLSMQCGRLGVDRSSLKYLDEYPDATLEIVYAIDDGTADEYDRVRFTHVSEYVDRLVAAGLTDVALEVETKLIVLMAQANGIDRQIKEMMAG